METTLQIQGMTCGHCEMSVNEELSELPGVTAVKSDHTTNSAVVTSDAPLDESAVRAAVAQAGYELVGIN